MSGDLFYPEPYRFEELVEDVKTKKNVQIAPATLTSPFKDFARAQKLPVDNVFSALENEIMRLIERKGDWTWLTDEVTTEELSASEALKQAKRYSPRFQLIIMYCTGHQQSIINTFLCRLAVILNEMGLKKGDIVHAIIGNHNATFSLAFAIWILGAILSTGDINLEAKAIGLQVKVTTFFPSFINCFFFQPDSWKTQMPSSSFAPQQLLPWLKKQWLQILIERSLSFFVLDLN